MTAERLIDNSPKNVDRALLSALLAVGLGSVYALIRTLGDRDFRNDEAYTYCFVTASWSNFVDVIRHLDAGVVVYYLLARAWSSLSGASEISLRSFSVLFALLSVVAIYYLSAELFSRRVAMTASLLLLCNSFWFQQAQTARVYAFAGFLSIAASFAFVRFVRSTDGRFWTTLYFAFMAFLVISQLAIGLTLFAAHILSFYALSGRRIPVLRTLPLVIALSLVLALVTYVVTSVGATLLHTPVHITPRVVWVQIASLLGRKASLVVLGLLAVYGTVFGGRIERSNALSLALWTIVPIVIIVTMSRLDPSTLGSRYMLSALFPFLILASNGLWLLQWRSLTGISLAVAVLAEGYGLHEYLKEPRRNFDAQLVSLTSRARRDDAVLFVPPYLAVRVFMALHNDKLDLQTGVQTIPSPLDTAWQTVDQQMLQPAWSQLPALHRRHLWVVTMTAANSRDDQCDPVTPRVAKLQPASTTILCLPRERQ